MKRSEVVKAIADALRNMPANSEEGLQEAAKAALEVVIKMGMEPKQRDYIEHYAFKSDRSWEKEQ